MTTKKQARLAAKAKREAWEAEQKRSGLAALERDRQRRIDETRVIELRKLRSANAYLDSLETIS